MLFRSVLVNKLSAAVLVGSEIEYTASRKNAQRRNTLRGKVFQDGIFRSGLEKSFSGFGKPQRIIGKSGAHELTKLSLRVPTGLCV